MMFRRRRRLILTCLVVLALHHFGPSWRQLFPGPEARRIQRLFRFSQRELGDLLDDVKLRFVDDLEWVVVMDREGRVQGQQAIDEHGSAEQVLEDVSARTHIHWGELQVEQFPIVGVYSPSDRLIRISLSYGPDLGTGGHEIAHAALRVPYARIDAAQRGTASSLNEAIAEALGGIDLVAEFMVKEEHVPADEASRQRAELMDEFWRLSDADPDPRLSSGSEALAERYRHSVVVHAIVDRIVSRQISLREKFILGREAILLHTMTIE
jgi:hypothetical protein